MAWFRNLFRPFDPPSDKQVRFAKSMGINVTASMSKQDVSEAIDKAKATDKESYGRAIGRMRRGDQRVSYIVNGTKGEKVSDSDKEWLKSPEATHLVAKYKTWMKLTQKGELYGIVAIRNIATRRIDVDVASICDTDLDHDELGNVRVVVSASLPAVVKDSSGFQIIEWAKDLGWVSVDEFLVWEKLPNSFGDLFGCIVDSHADARDRRMYKRYEDALKRGRDLVKEKRLR